MGLKQYKKKEKGRENNCKRRGKEIQKVKVGIFFIVMQTENGFFHANQTNHNPNNYTTKTIVSKT